MIHLDSQFEGYFCHLLASVALKVTYITISDKRCIASCRQRANVIFMEPACYINVVKNNASRYFSHILVIEKKKVGGAVLTQYTLNVKPWCSVGKQFSLASHTSTQ